MIVKCNIFIRNYFVKILRRDFFLLKKERERALHKENHTSGGTEIIVQNNKQ